MKRKTIIMVVAIILLIAAAILLESCGPSRAEIEAKMKTSSDTTFIREIGQREIEIPDHCNICYHVIKVGDDTIVVSYARSSGTLSTVKLSK